MAQGKIDKAGLWSVLFWVVFFGALYSFGYTTPWGAHLLNAFESLMLLWGFLTPLYLLIRMGIAAWRRRQAARLGLTYEEFEAKRHPGRQTRVPGAGGVPSPRRRPFLSRWVHRLLRVSEWELILFTALLVLFGILTQRLRQGPGEHVGVTGLGWFYALALYSFLGLQLLHRVWAHWHHRLAPGSAPPATVPGDEPLPGRQRFWNTAFGCALVFAVVELVLTGGGEAGAVVFAFVAPALMFLLLDGVWRMVRPLFRHRHAETA